MKPRIESLSDLHLELARLKLQATQHEAVLASHAKSVMNKLHTPMMLLNKLQSWFGNGSSDRKEGSDWVSHVFQVVLPLTLNKIFFRKSNFIVKTIAALVSQNAATLIHKDTIVNLVDTISQWIKNTKTKKEEKNNLDFGIPPDSETY